MGWQKEFGGVPHGSVGARRMTELGAVFYRGPSLLTGDPIVGILTGLEGGSMNPKIGPTNVYKAFCRGDYIDASWPELQALLEARHVRLGAYGDPAAIPFEIWRVLLTTTAGHVAYTHQWKRCDPRFREISMASVDSE